MNYRKILTLTDRVIRQFCIYTGKEDRTNDGHEKDTNLTIRVRLDRLFSSNVYFVQKQTATALRSANVETLKLSGNRIDDGQGQSYARSFIYYVTVHVNQNKMLQLNDPQMQVRRKMT